MTEAQIVVTYHRDEPFGAQRITYAWHGAPGAVAAVADEADITDAPWPLRVVGRQAWRRSTLVVRADVRWWRVTAARYALQRAWRWFTIRAVLTLYVWGLADRDDAVNVTWRQVRWPWRHRRGT